MSEQRVPVDPDLNSIASGGDADAMRLDAGNAILTSEQRFRAFVTAISDVVYRMNADWTEMHVTAFFEQQRRLYQTILSSTPDLVYVFGLDHRFIYANHALLAMWGKTWDEASGRNCLELGYEPWHAEMHDREIDTVIATREPICGEVPFTGTQGRRTYDYIFVPVFGAHGEVEAVAGTTRDITERKRSEDAVRESEQRLAGANRLKDEFLATLSHELRTPLNAVLGWSHMLRTGTLRPDVRERALQSLERNARAQAQLVEDLLDVSRIMSGKLAIEGAAFDLTAVIAESVDAVRPAAAAKDIRLGVGVNAGAGIDPRPARQPGRDDSGHRRHRVCDGAGARRGSRSRLQRPSWEAGRPRTAGGRDCGRGSRRVGALAAGNAGARR